MKVLTRLLYIFTCAVPALAIANPVMVKVPTDQGCAIMVDQAVLDMQKRYKLTVQRRWSGACARGLAEGPGVLTELSDGSRSVITSHFGLGKPYGFYKFEQIAKPVTSTASGISLDFSHVSWGFNGGDPALQLSFNGLGFAAFDPLKIDHRYVPERSPAVLGAKSTLHVSGLGMLTLSNESCTLHGTRFPDCGFGEGKRDFDVWAVRQYSAGPHTRHDVRLTLCPDPLVAASCKAILDREVERFVSAAQTILKIGRPIAEVLEADSTRALLRQAELDAAKAAQKAATQSVPAAAAEPLAESWLESAGVGELLARADELVEARRLDDARVTLRKLITRFPNHFFAAKAADSLSSLPRN